MIKHLVLTGISQETSFDSPDDVLFLLVFNNGEVRVPTSESGVHSILGYLGATEEETEEEAPEAEVPPGVEVFGSDSEDEDGVTDDYDYDVNDGVGSI